MPSWIHSEMTVIRQLNLGLRFFLEIAGLVLIGLWGWHQAGGLLRIVLAIGLPVIAAALWGVFRVPNDPGPALIPVRGGVRLLLELAFFGFATWTLFDRGAEFLGLTLGVIILLHYLFAFDRLLRLIRQ